MFEKQKHMGEKIKYTLYGNAQHICMFSYEIYLEHLTEYYEMVSNPKDADVIFVTYVQNIRDNFNRFYNYQKGSNAKIIILSEEPLWDLSWSSTIKWRGTQQIVYGRRNKIKIDIERINFINTDVFSYKKIPFFLTTQKVYTDNYLNFIDKLETENIEDIIQKKNYDVSGVFSCRVQPINNEFNLGDDIDKKCLNTFRSLLGDTFKENSSLKCDFFGNNNSEYEGLTDITIYDSTEFHKVKLNWCIDNAKFLFSFENTMLRTYVTEKVFDAAASASVPIFCQFPDEKCEFRGINIYDYITNDYETMYNSVLCELEKTDIVDVVKYNLEILKSVYKDGHDQVQTEIKSRILRLNDEVRKLL